MCRDIIKKTGSGRGFLVMQKPKMLLFDYGQTLVDEEKFDGVRGTEAVMNYCVVNKHNLTAERIQEEADRINKELGRFEPEKKHLFEVEAPNHMFTAYLYESLGIELSISSEEIDRVFWDAAAPGKPTEHAEEFLDFLWQNGIRSGVISNISFAGKVVKERIDRLLPDNHFEFVIATSEYLFRKPNRRIFDLALEKAGISPEDAWYVGDNYECDIAGAKRAGIFSVWYLGASEGRRGSEADILTVANWNELEKIILHTET